jgi:hypothetical protein
MSSTSQATVDEISALLGKLRKDQREYLLFRLVSEKIVEQDPVELIEIHRPDGSLFGHIRALTPPTPAEEVEMTNRAKRHDPSAGRPTRNLLDRMKTGDVKSVQKFIDS